MVRSSRGAEAVKGLIEPGLKTSGERMMTTEHYQGSCQCGAVSYEVAVDTDRTITCNCSRCQRMGFVLAFAPASDFRLQSGAGNLTEYLFNKKEIRHLFCRTCGVESFAYGKTPDGTQMVAINVKCVSGVVPRALTSQAVDRRNT